MFVVVLSLWINDREHTLILSTSRRPAIRSIGPEARLAYTGNMSELLSPLEWVFVVILALVPLAGLAFHLWVMLAGHGKRDAGKESK